MSVQYFSYPGYGQIAKEKAHYSQAVRIGNRIECAGQGKSIRYYSILTPSIRSSRLTQSFLYSPRRMEPRNRHRLSKRPRRRNRPSVPERGSRRPNCRRQRGLVAGFPLDLVSRCVGRRSLPGYGPQLERVGA